MFEIFVVLQARKHGIESECAEVLVDKPHRMDFRADGLVERLRPALPEIERADVVDGSPGRPAIAQIGAPHPIEAESTVFLRRTAAIGRAAVLDSVEDHVIVRAGQGLASQIDVVRVAPGEVVDHADRLCRSCG